MRAAGALRRIGSLTNDFHAKEPLQDIIDPNLCPRKIDPAEQQQQQQHNKEEKKTEEEAEEEEEDGDDGEGGNAKARALRAEIKALRATYHWIPATVFFGADGRARILTDVHHAVRRADNNEQLYTALEAGACADARGLVGLCRHGHCLCVCRALGAGRVLLARTREPTRSFDLWHLPAPLCGLCAVCSALFVCGRRARCIHTQRL